MNDEEYQANLGRSSRLREMACDLMSQPRFDEAEPLHDEADRLLRECEENTQAMERQAKRQRTPKQRLGRSLGRVRVRTRRFWTD
jgi:hypothetical protein